MKICFYLYLQSWGHEKLSKIVFGIRPTRLWSSTNGTAEVEVWRQADIYLFCLLKHEEKESLDPLDLDQWEFYLLRSSVLDERCSQSKTISLGRLKGLNPRVINYGGLAACVKEMSAEIRRGDG